MNLYERLILPPLLDMWMRQPEIEEYRGELIPAARGRVLEVGVGSGLNFPHYGADVTTVVGLDPSMRLLSMARRRADQAGAPVELMQGSATAIPLGDDSVDTLVMTWTLCSIPDPLAALREMRRVLKLGGALLFVEHGLSPEPAVARWKHWLTPVWRHIAGGCHLDRKVDDLLRDAGFEIAELKTAYADGPRPMTYMYQGRAVSTRLSRRERGRGEGTGRLSRRANEVQRESAPARRQGRRRPQRL